MDAAYTQLPEQTDAVGTELCRQMHTVIAGMLGAQQEGDGEDACVGLVGVITVAASIIPDIIRCTFDPDQQECCFYTGCPVSQNTVTQKTQNGPIT